MLSQGFEQLEGVGGTWRFTDRVGTMENGLPVQSSMYRNLKLVCPYIRIRLPLKNMYRNYPMFFQTLKNNYFGEK